MGAGKHTKEELNLILGAQGSTNTETRLDPYPWYPSSELQESGHLSSFVPYCKPRTLRDADV